MKSKKFVLGMLALALIFGLMVVGCPESGPELDPLINGTWVNDTYGQAFEFTNGNFEVSMGNLLAQKGTYSTSGNNITMVTTHVHGNFLNTIYEESEFNNAFYSRSEFIALSMFDGRRETPDFLNFVDGIFGAQQATYSISGNVLTITGTTPEGQSTTTFTKQ